jgi:hypothetical protein
MSEISLTLVQQIKTSKIINGMAKVSKKSEKITAFGGIKKSVKRCKNQWSCGVGWLECKSPRGRS